jgi:hypothetical protein
VPLMLTLPSLRERAEDISLLSDYFVAKASRKCRMRAKPKEEKPPFEGGLLVLFGIHFLFWWSRLSCSG